MNEQYINDLAKRVFAENVERGWWDDMDRDFHQTMMLVVTEISEGTEGVRKDLMDTHLTHRKMEEVELADTAIRLLDLAGRYKWTYQPTSSPDGLSQHYFKNKRFMPEAAEHFALVELCVDLARAQREGNFSWAEYKYSTIMDLLMSIAKSRVYFDLQKAIEEKLAYNRQRADHKRENRAAVGGKRF